MGKIEVATAGLVFVALLTAMVVAVVRMRGASKHRDHQPVGLGPQRSDREILHDRRGSQVPPARGSRPLRQYQYLAVRKIDLLYEQAVEAGARAATTTSELGSSSIAKVGNTLGPPAELTTVQKLEVLRTRLRVEDAYFRGFLELGTRSPVLIQGSMLMKHAVLPVVEGEESPTQAVWIGRLSNGRFICLGGSASNMDPSVPRGKFLNSGVSGVLQAIRLAHGQVEVPFQPDVRTGGESAEPPTHQFPGAWDAEVVDVWAHLRDLHAHHVSFVAQPMTASNLDIESARYDVLVGSPLSVEYA
ncbi:hypothetical protein GL325_06045 [Aeromicrobium sp. 636]|uniref:Uncharacterized protein n=1 Tax=Aeromicrobium senzhongii TaxID=2663859 RepID=A0A8I0EUP0_9ACTN|nr:MULTISPECIES: hypothetical protein [Aeromicrobium]MBC9225874.1 hypothetical protein [Aeromicrobium senzhongii]MCQ3997981.1 hypothetical protein [Aeromicrobium sp. 636]